jgi:hypothetical protein
MNDVEEEVRLIRTALADNKEVFVFLTQKQAEDIADDFDPPNCCIADYDEFSDRARICHFLMCDSSSNIELDNDPMLFEWSFEEGNSYDDELLVSYAAVKRYLLECAEADESEESESLDEQADVLRSRLLDDLECYVFLTREQARGLDRHRVRWGNKNLIVPSDGEVCCMITFVDDLGFCFDLTCLDHDDFEEPEERDLFSFEIVKCLVERGMKPRKFKAKTPIRATDTFTSEGPRPNLLGL